MEQAAATASQQQPTPPPVEMRPARPTRLGRLVDYVREMFPPAVTVPGGVASFLSMYLLMQAAHLGPGPVRLTPSAAVGAATLVLVMLLLRVFDELKDLETDKVHFPTRPVPSGRVTARDLRAFAIAIVAARVIGNAAVGGVAFLGFAALFGWCLLTFRYFFIPDIMRPSLLLTVATHQPLVPLMSFYAVCVFARDFGVSPFTTSAAWAVPLFWLPGLAWETGRKIRAPEAETSYQTYSQIFGTRPSVLLPALSIAGSTAIAFAAFGRPLGLSWAWFGVVAAAALVTIGACLRFLVRPSPSASKLLKPSAELFIVALHGATVVELLVRRGIAA